MNKISIVISAIALVVSMLSAVVSYQLQMADNQRSSREQLHKTINDIMKLGAENSTLRFIPAENHDLSYYFRLSINSQNASALSRQAVYLVNQIPDLITDVEFSIIAQGLIIAGDIPLADFYWRKAVETSPSDYYKVVNTRGYADFLFNLGKYELSRDSYSKATRIFDNNTDTNKAINAYTYQMWMVNELSYGFNEEAQTQYSRAKNLCNSISQSPAKNGCLSGLEKAKAGLPVSTTPAASIAEKQ